MIIKLLSSRDFERKLTKFANEAPNRKTLDFEQNCFWGNEEPNGRLLIKDFRFQEYELDVINFHHLHFSNCIFEKVQLTQLEAYDCVFENCIFDNTRITNSVFFMCKLTDCIVKNSKWVYVLFTDTEILNFNFNHCHELLEMYFGGCDIENLNFRNSYIAHSRFPPINIGTVSNHFNFIESQIHSCSFLNLDLGKTVFINCEFEQSIFSNCVISKNTFQKENHSVKDAYCSLDFQTIKASEIINEDVLMKVFGIHHSNIRNYIFELTTPICFQSIFISYSFKDKVFASKLNEMLRLKGVYTFLWEKDAPGGKPLKKIMSEEIRKFDRLLFIASENSIKSKSCQFELTQGRVKQEELWTTIFFPVHIDNYLFEVKKEDIKPKEVADEYWNNILELRDVNSIDFTEFKNEGFEQLHFQNRIDSLINELKK